MTASTTGFLSPWDDWPDELSGFSRDIGTVWLMRLEANIASSAVVEMYQLRHADYEAERWYVHCIVYLVLISASGYVLLALEGLTLMPHIHV